jgi:hypothetical protein
VADSRDLDRLLDLASAAPYRCPGETYSIGRALHLARLNSGYEACRHCPQRHEGPDPLAALQITEQSLSANDRLWCGRGWRGVSLNEATRPRVLEVVAGFGTRLREALGGQAPFVVAGHDHRATSPELFVGALAGLRRAGCAILDVGAVHEPLAWHILTERAAHAAVYVTGAGCDPDWNGLDFALAGPRPLSPDEARGGLGEVLAASMTSAPALTTTHIRRFESYERRLLEAFHALRPLGLVVGIGPGPQAHWLRRALASTACRLIEVPVSISADTSTDSAALGRIEAAMHESSGVRVDLAALLHEDGFGLTLFDERGDRVPPAALAGLAGAVPSPTRTECWRDLLWIDDGDDPFCDALFLLAALLRRLSASDRVLSEVWSRQDP